MFNRQLTLNPPTKLNNKIERKTSSILINAGKLILHRVGDYLIVGGGAASLYILLAPQDVLNKYVCQNYSGNSTNLINMLNKLIYDHGIFTFHTAGAMRAIMIPTAHWAYKKVWDCVNREKIPAPTLSPSFKKFIRTMETEILKTASMATAINLIPTNSSAAAYTLQSIFNVPSCLNAGLPYIINNHPGNAPLAKFKEAFPDSSAKIWAFAGLQGVSNAMSLALALHALTYFFVDTFYDSTHVDDLPYGAQLQIGIAMLGVLISLLSMLNDTAHQISSTATDILQQFYLLTMPLISTIFCLDPELEDMSTFMSKSIYVILTIAAFSALVAGLNVKFNEYSSVSVSELSEDESSTDEDSESLLQSHSDRETTWNKYGTFNNESSSDEDADDEYGNGLNYSL